MLLRQIYEGLCEFIMAQTPCRYFFFYFHLATLTYSPKGYGFLLGHVGLPQVVIVAVHLVICCSGWGKGIILRHSY